MLLKVTMALINNVVSTPLLWHKILIKGIGCTTYTRRYTPLDGLFEVHLSSRVYCLYSKYIGSISNVYYIEPIISMLYKTQFGVNYSVHHEVIYASVH